MKSRGRGFWLAAPLMLLASGCAATVPMEEHRRVLDQLQDTQELLKRTQQVRDRFREYAEHHLPQAIHEKKEAKALNRTMASQLVQKRETIDNHRKELRIQKILLEMERAERVRERITLMLMLGGLNHYWNKKYEEALKNQKPQQHAKRDERDF